MSLVSSCCFLTALLILLTCLRRGADIFSPAGVFGFMWSIAIGLADLKLSRLQHEWSIYSWLTLLIGVASFLVGIFIVQVLFLHRHQQSIDSIRARIFNRDINTQRFFYFIVLLFGTYCCAYIIEWAAYGKLPLFAEYPDRARSEMGIFGIHLFIGSMPVLLFLIVEFFILIKKNVLKKTILIVLFTLTFISYFLLLNRLHYIMFLVMALAFAYYTTRRVTPRNVIIVVVSVIGCLALLQSFREARYAEHFLYVISDMKFSSTYAAFTGPYMYIVMNLENFARAVERLQQFTFGYFTLDFLSALTGLKHWLADYYGLEERIFLVSGYNTFPFLWDYYYDFGIMGLTFLPMLLGGGISLLHKWMRSQPSSLNIALYSIAVFVMVMSFFVNLLSMLGFVFEIALLLLSQIIITTTKSERYVRLT